MAIKTRSHSRTSPICLPKVVGADIELGNAILGLRKQDGTGPEASRLLLRYMEGVPGSAYTTIATPDPQDIGRKWHRNGSCTYIDLDHAEIALPETRSAWEFTAALHAQLKLVEQARIRANGYLPPGQALQVVACNTDGSGTSWGSHLNFLISRDCFDRIFHLRLDLLLWLASYQASAIVICGQGKVGSDNGTDPVDYQISQRADFIEEVVALQTTFKRPIINSRDESLCGLSPDLARFHHISSDMNLCHTANVLKVGALQILLAMVEVDSPYICSELVLREPVRAFLTFSHDPELNATEPTIAGNEVTMLELQRRFLDAASAFVATGACDQAVPRANDILALWDDTLTRLETGDWDTLTRRLDWVLKRALLEEVLAEEPDLTWESAHIKKLDLLYGSLDPAEGLYFAMEAAGHVDTLVEPRQIRRFLTAPPSGTRAYTRGNMVRLFGRETIVSVDWDRIAVRYPERAYYPRTRTVLLDNPLTHTREETGWLFRTRKPAAHLTVLNQLETVISPSPPFVTGNAGLVRPALHYPGTGKRYS